MLKYVVGIVLSIVGATALTVIALHRHETVNALWIVTAAVCIFLLGYRFYSAWIAARVL
jgi:carbon starvation protein